MKRFLIAIVAILVITALTGCGNKKTLHCTTEQNTNGVVYSSSIDVSFNGNTAEKIEVSMKITVPDAFASFMDTFNSTLEEQRSKLESAGYTVNITAEDNVLKLSAVGTDKTLTDEEKTGSYAATKKSYEQQGLTCK